jgi:hypothetical protein
MTFARAHARRPALAAVLTSGAVLLAPAAPVPGRAASPAPIRGGGAAAGAAAAGPPSAGPREAGCPVLPADNPLNRDISHTPVDRNSTAYIAAIGPSLHLHADFGSNPSYGMPYVIVGPRQPRLPIRFSEFGDESDPGPYPIPPGAPVEGAGQAGDHHVLVLQRGSCRLYELYNAQRSGRGWQAGSGAAFNLRRNALRHEGWTSADAAGLPIFPLLARYPEARGGAIRHALRVTVARTQRAYIHPATHFASSSRDTGLPPMGLRLRLKAGFSFAGYHGQALVVLRALKRYGLIVADNGSSWFITGAPDRRWRDEDLDQLKHVPGSAFEAVYSGRIHTG